jgi:predicted DNA-binding transcriptional regulator AlpA
MEVKHGQNQPQGEDRPQSVPGIPHTIMTSRKEVLTPEDLAEVLGISVWTIYAKTSKRNRYQTNVDLPPFFRMGKLIRFWRRDLVSWLESRKKIDPNKP